MTLPALPPDCAAKLPVTLLVVDDHTLLRRGLIALLSQDEGLQVVGEAGDAAQAQRLAQRLQPQVILLDNHLPGVRGIDAIAGLREVAPASRVVMLTVSEDAKDLATALRNGAQGYLLKTIDGDLLAQAIHRAAAGEPVVSPELMGKLVEAFQSQGVPDASSATPTSPASPASAASAATTATLATGAVAAHGLSASAAPVSPATGATAAAASPEPAVLDAPDCVVPSAPLSPREEDVLQQIMRGASNKEIARTLDIAETTVKIHVQHILRKLSLSSRVQAAVYASDRQRAG